MIWKRIRRFRKSTLIFFAVVGPGLITATVDNDAGGIFIASEAGARYGYDLLWTLIPILVTLIIIQEMCTRMGVVTGKGLADLIREEYGLRATFILLVGLVMANFSNIIAEFAGVATSLEIFGLSRYVSVPIGAIVVWGLVVKGTYRSVEKVFLVACLFYLAYFASAFLAGPDWGEALSSTLTPQIHYEPAYLFMTIGMTGAVIAPWMQFYQQSSVVEKGIKVNHFRQARWDVILGSMFSAALVFFIIVGCAVTLYQSGQHRIEDAAQAAQALEPLAGRWASTLFAFGLCNASLLAASVLPLATAYYVCEGLGLEAGINRKFHEAPAFYWLYTALVFGGASIVLIPQIPLIPVILLSQVVNGFLLPVVLVFILRLSSRKDLMGEYRNHLAFNIIAWFAVFLMGTLAVMAALSGIFPKHILN